MLNLQAAPWLEGGLVDITRHQDDQLNAVPRDLQLRAKMVRSFFGGNYLCNFSVSFSFIWG